MGGGMLMVAVEKKHGVNELDGRCWQLVRIVLTAVRGRSRDRERWLLWARVDKACLGGGG